MPIKTGLFLVLFVSILETQIPIAEWKLIIRKYQSWAWSTFLASRLYKRALLYLHNWQKALIF